MFATDSILPPEPEGPETLHDRECRVRAHPLDDHRILTQGAVGDQKPPGLHHTNALLQAMAPIAMQCFWSRRAAKAKLEGEASPIVGRDRGRHDDGWKRIIGTSHIRDPDGPRVAARLAGADEDPPLFLRSRLAELGVDSPALGGGS